MPIELTSDNCKFSKKFKKQLSKLNPSVKKNIESKLSSIFAGKLKADLKKLCNYQIADYRLKIGNYRLLIAYDEKNDESYFISCKHRKDLY
jgi:mRNA-degrading endonuclease RelE of RelBE toxin-antitoxin system